MGAAAYIAKILGDAHASEQLPWQTHLLYVIFWGLLGATCSSSWQLRLHGTLIRQPGLQQINRKAYDAICRHGQSSGGRGVVDIIKHHIDKTNSSQAVHAHLCLIEEITLADTRSRLAHAAYGYLEVCALTNSVTPSEACADRVLGPRGFCGLEKLNLLAVVQGSR